MSNTTDMISLAELKSERGWTVGLVKMFLPDPDKTKPNPYYKHAGAPMKLFRLTRVAEIESSDEFKCARAKAEVRKTTAKKGIATKTAKCVAGRQDRLNSIAVTIMSRDALIKNAIGHYNSRGSDHDPASKDSDPAFLDRIAVNYLRHMETQYDPIIALSRGRVGTRKAYKITKQNVLEKIAQAYPFLKAECDRQLQRASEDFDALALVE